MSKFTDLLADFSSEKRFLVVLEPYDPVAGAVVTIRLSSSGFTTAPGDIPANTHYEARVASALNFTRSLFQQGRLSGRSIPGEGEIGLNNVDGALDGLAGYAWGGRRVRVWLGGPGFALADYGLIYDGTAQGLEFGEVEIRVKLRDLQYVFDREFQQAVFAGTGGVEGGADLKDKLRPRLLGFCRAVTPIYLGPDSGRHLFALGDGPIIGVDRVLDRGVPLTQVANATAPGEWSVDLATGILALGGAYDGPLCIDAAGWRYRSEASASSLTIGIGGRAFAVASLAGFVIGQRVRARAGSGPALNWMEGVVTAAAGGVLTIAMDRIAGSGSYGAWTLCPLGTAAGLAWALALAAGVAVSASSITALDAAQPATVGTWRPDGGQASDLLDELIDGIGGYWGFTRAGEFEVGRLTAPGAPVSGVLLDATTILDIERTPTVEPSHEVVVRYARAWTTHSADQIAGAASDADRLFLTNEWRQSRAADPATLTAWPLSQAITVDGPFAFEADAAAEAARLLSIYAARRDRFVVRSKIQPLALDIGTSIALRFDRYGLGAGKNVLIVDMTEDLDDNEIELGLWG